MPIKDEIKLNIMGVEKIIKSNEIFDEFFKIFFANQHISKEFIRALGVIPKDWNINITGYHTDISLTGSMKDLRQDISIIAEIYAYIEKGEKRQNIIVMIEVQREKTYIIPIRLRTYAGIVSHRLTEKIIGQNITGATIMSQEKFFDIKGQVPQIIPVLLNLSFTPYDYGTKEDEEMEKIFKKRSFNKCHGIKLQGFDFEWIETNLKDWKNYKEFSDIFRHLGEIFENRENQREELVKMLQEEKSLYTLLKEKFQEEGKDEGMKEGMKEGIINTAIGFLKMGLTEEQVAEGTGLSLEEIEKLKVMV